MIVVTGTFRSGTSLMMQTLKLLGINIVGNKFDKWNRERWNPKGYWELPVDDTIDGIKDNRYEGKGIKLFVQQLTKTNPNLFSKAIRCTRSKSFAVKSYMAMLQSMPECGIPGTRTVCSELYDVGERYTKEYLEINNIPYINVDLADMREDPKKQIERVSDFLSLKSIDIKPAIENVGV